MRQALAAHKSWLCIVRRLCVSPGAMRRVAARLLCLWPVAPLPSRLFLEDRTLYRRLTVPGSTEGLHACPSFAGSRMSVPTVAERGSLRSPHKNLLAHQLGEWHPRQHQFGERVLCSPFAE